MPFEREEVTSGASIGMLKMKQAEAGELRQEVQSDLIVLEARPNQRLTRR